MSTTSVGQGGRRDGNENEVTDNKPTTFGEEGTNKTQPLPDPKARPSDVPGPGKHQGPTPFVR